jgi:predicted nucleotidyltransferase
MAESALMRRDDVIEKLREHQDELKAAGIVGIALFGSVARGESGNDVDLVAEFDTGKGLSLIDVAGLENRLSDLLGVKVDLVQRKSLKPRVRANVEREAVLAF